MIYIYKLEAVDGTPKMVEKGQYDGKSITGSIAVDDISREEVLEQYNRGYWRTGEIKEDK